MKLRKARERYRMDAQREFEAHTTWFGELSVFSSLWLEYCMKMG